MIRYTITNIPKKILILLMCTISSATINTVFSPGENIWQLIKDIGTITDAIEVLANNIGNVSCPNTITQNDINLGTYTITQPGTYCLAEDIINESLSSPMIVINSNNVVLDLKNHVAICNSTVCEISSGIHNVIIQNGIINAEATIGVKIDDNTSTIIFNNLSIIQGAPCIMNLAGTPFTNIIINNCFINGGSSLNFVGDASTTNNILINDTIFSSLTPINATFTSCINTIIQDCIGQNSVFNFNLSTSITIKDSIFTSQTVNNMLSFSFTNATKIGISNIHITGSSRGVLFVNTSTDAIVLKNMILNGFNGGGTSSGIRASVLGTGKATFQENTISGCARGIFITASTNIASYANCIAGNGTNYVGVTVVPIQIAPDSSTTYWANVSNA